MVKIAPSLLSADFGCLKDELAAISKADWLHYDVMDGHFVPNISFGYSVLKDVSKVTDLYLDVHLMISEPMKYAGNFIDSKASSITFHYEAIEENKINEFINYLKEHQVAAGISIKPDTDVSVLKPYLDSLDLILVMSVEPGFGGQKFDDRALAKIVWLAKMKEEMGYHYLIEVDGGINEETGKLCKDAGVDVLVAGSYIFGSDNYQEKIDSLR